jgi:sporulation protein YabP
MEEKKHSVFLENRKSLSLDGIESVESFREDAVELISKMGPIQITGIGLHMEKLDLDKGVVVLTGTVISLYYPQENTGEKRGLLKRMFS